MEPVQPRFGVRPGTLDRTGVGKVRPGTLDGTGVGKVAGAVRLVRRAHNGAG